VDGSDFLNLAIRLSVVDGLHQVESQPNFAEIGVAIRHYAKATLRLAVTET